MIDRRVLPEVLGQIDQFDDAAHEPGESMTASSADDGRKPVEGLQIPVDVLDRVLDGDQPLLALPPRRQEDTPIVLIEPGGLGVAPVDCEEISIGAHRLGAVDDTPFCPCGGHVAVSSCRPTTSLAPFSMRLWM